MRGQYAQAANKHMMKIGSSVDYVRSGGMRNVPVTKAVEHLYATTAKFSGCVLLASRPPYSFPPHGSCAFDSKNSVLFFYVHWKVDIGRNCKKSVL
ncbi:hypothetical protein AVEN_232663-1 [Araneus ventricosus]|uniref:Uncharacterized protein n=1 Tax=Araneus ventricosus TaxID=182803 RepID=A0A4Y2NG24_ARAVE|nr:hypothetical protein AVEN_232663-1 [Araneus ventricosus]